MTEIDGVKAVTTGCDTKTSEDDVTSEVEVAQHSYRDVVIHDRGRICGLSDVVQLTLWQRINNSV